MWTRCWCRCWLRGPVSRAGPSRLASPDGVIANICAVVIEAEAHRYKLCVPCPRYWYHFSENSAFFFFFFCYVSINRHPWLLFLTSTQSLFHYLSFARVEIMPFVSVPLSPSPLGESSLAVACSHRRVMDFPRSAEPGSVLPKRTSCERASRELRQSS